MEFLELVGFLVFVFFAICVAIVVIFVAISVIGAASILLVGLLKDFFREKSSDEIRISEIYKEIFKIQDREKEGKSEPDDTHRQIELYLELGKVRNHMEREKSDSF